MKKSGAVLVLVVMLFLALNLNFASAKIVDTPDKADIIILGSYQGGAALVDKFALTTAPDGGIANLKKRVDILPISVYVKIGYNPGLLEGGQDGAAKSIADFIKSTRAKGGYNAVKPIIVISAAHSYGSADEYQKRFVDSFVYYSDYYENKYIGHALFSCKTGQYQLNENCFQFMKYYNPNNVVLVVAGHDTNTGYPKSSDPNKRWPFVDSIKDNGGLVYIRYIMNHQYGGNWMRSKPDPQALNVVTDQDHWTIAKSAQLQEITLEIALAMIGEQTMDLQKTAARGVLDSFAAKGVISHRLLPEEINSWREDGWTKVSPPVDFLKKEEAGNIADCLDGARMSKINDYLQKLKQTPATPPAQPAVPIPEIPRQASIVKNPFPSVYSVDVLGNMGISPNPGKTQQEICQIVKSWEDACKNAADKGSDVACKPQPMYSVSLTKAKSKDNAEVGCMFDSSYLPLSSLNTNPTETFYFVPDDNPLANGGSGSFWTKDDGSCGFQLLPSAAINGQQSEFLQAFTYSSSSPGFMSVQLKDLLGLGKAEEFASRVIKIGDAKNPFGSDKSSGEVSIFCTTKGVEMTGGFEDIRSKVGEIGKYLRTEILFPMDTKNPWYKAGEADTLTAEFQFVYNSILQQNAGEMSALVRGLPEKFTGPKSVICYMSYDAKTGVFGWGRTKKELSCIGAFDVSLNFVGKPGSEKAHTCTNNGNNFACEDGTSCRANERVRPSLIGDIANQFSCKIGQVCCETDTCKKDDLTDSNICRPGDCSEGETDLTTYFGLKCFGTDRCCMKTCGPNGEGICRKESSDSNSGCKFGEISKDVAGYDCLTGDICCVPKPLTDCEKMGPEYRCEPNEYNVDGIHEQEVKGDSLCSESFKCVKSIKTPTTPPVTPTQTTVKTGCEKFGDYASFDIALLPVPPYQFSGIAKKGDCVSDGKSPTPKWWFVKDVNVAGKVGDKKMTPFTGTNNPQKYVWTGNVGKITLTGAYDSKPDCVKANTVNPAMSPEGEVTGGIFSNYDTLNVENTGTLSGFIGGLEPNQGWTIIGVDFVNSVLTRIGTGSSPVSCGPDCIQWRGTVGTMHAARCKDSAGRFISCLGNDFPSECDLRVDEVVSASGHAPADSTEGIQFSYILQIFPDDALISGQEGECGQVQGGITGLWAQNPKNGISYSTTPISSSSSPDTITFVPNVLLVSGAAAMSKVIVTPGTCTPETDDAFCTKLGKACGEVTGDDICGNTKTVVSCGTCSGSETCQNGNCQSNVQDTCTNPATGYECKDLGNIGSGPVCIAIGKVYDNTKNCPDGTNGARVCCKPKSAVQDITVDLSGTIDCENKAVVPVGGKNHLWSLVISPQKTDNIEQSELKNIFSNRNINNLILDGSFIEDSDKITLNDAVLERGKATATPSIPVPPTSVTPTPTPKQNSPPTITNTVHPIIAGSDVMSSNTNAGGTQTETIWGVRGNNKIVATNDGTIKWRLPDGTEVPFHGGIGGSTPSAAFGAKQDNLPYTASVTPEATNGVATVTGKPVPITFCPSSFVESNRPTTKIKGVTVNSNVAINFRIIGDSLANTNSIPYTGAMSVTIAADTSTLTGIIHDGSTVSADFGWFKRVDTSRRVDPKTGLDSKTGLPVNKANPWVLEGANPCAEGTNLCAITPQEIRNCISMGQECTFQSTASADLGAQGQGISQDISKWKASRITIVFDLDNREVRVSDAANPIKSDRWSLTELNAYSMIKLLEEIGDKDNAARLSKIFEQCISNYATKRVGTLTASPSSGVITYTLNSNKFSYYYLSNPLLINKEGFAVKLSSEAVPEKAFTRIFIYNGNDNKTKLYRFEDSEVEPDCDVTIMNDTEINVPASGGNFSALGVGFSFPDGTFKDGARVEVQGVWVSNCKTENPAGANSSQDIWIIVLGLVVLIIIVVVIIVMAMKERNRDFLS